MNLILQDLVRFCRGEFAGDPSLLREPVGNIVIDSRKVVPGSVFVAIDGHNVNAHRFIPDVVRAGALCVVTHENPGKAPFPYILVPSTGQALLDIAKGYRDSFPVKVVGITGSVGKTSTKEMVASVLSSKYNVHKTIGNFNNEWGLPLTIFRLEPAHEIAVLEMGVNHFDEMRRLSSVSSPDVCLITNIGDAHLEFFKTREGILKEKSKMILDMKPGGQVILNGDDPLLRTLSLPGDTESLFYGRGKDCALTASDIEPLGLKGTRLSIIFPDGQSLRCTIPAPGEHMVANALAGAAAGYTLGLSPEDIRTGIENLPAMPGRNHLITTEDYVILDDCYNANPVSMRAAIDVLSLSRGRKVAILGDMGELGEDSEHLHFDVGAYGAAKGIDVICAVGTLAESIEKGARSVASHSSTLWFPSKKEFFRAMDQILVRGDNILIKASHGMAFEDITSVIAKEKEIK